MRFTTRRTLTGVAVDSKGGLYLADPFNRRVVKLDADTKAPTTLPLTGLKNPYGLAVGLDDAVYVTDSTANRVY